jgi:tetratricopeptide (TPR) repeat protein
MIVSHISRSAPKAERQFSLSCDWSLWEDMGIATPEVCSVIERDDITEKAAIGMMALLIAKLEACEILDVLQRGTGADYKVRVQEPAVVLPVEVSGLSVAKYPSESKIRLHEKQDRLLKYHQRGFVSVTTFSHPPNGLPHSYLHYVSRSQSTLQVAKEPTMVTNPRESPKRDASILSMEGETALYSADNALAREKHAKAAKILHKLAEGTRGSAELHSLRFSAATQYYKAGFYDRALKLTHRIQSRFLPSDDERLFQQFCKEVRKRASKGYEASIRQRLEHYQKRDDFRSLASLVIRHPFVFDRVTLAFIRAYTSIRLKHYSAAGSFAAAACRFAVNSPTKLLEMAFLPYLVELTEGLQEGWKAAQNFAKFFKHPAGYLVASSMAYRLANAAKGEVRRELARKVVEYFNKATLNDKDLSVHYRNDSEFCLFLFACTGSAAIAFIWLGDPANASAALEAAESTTFETKENADLIRGIRDFIASSHQKDVIDAEPPVVPSGKIIDGILGRTERYMKDQIEVALMS